jgi:phage-related tail protein
MSLFLYDLNLRFQRKANGYYQELEKNMEQSFAEIWDSLKDGLHENWSKGADKMDGKE